MKAARIHSVAAVDPATAVSGLLEPGEGVSCRRADRSTGVG